MEFKTLCKERFSVRAFSDEAINERQLEYILECARLAPSAVNLQPWKFYVMTSQRDRELLQRCYKREWLSQAPLYILCCVCHDVEWVRRDGKRHGDIDVAIATEHLCLAATERGLGTCWVCNFDTAAMHDMFPYDHLEAVAIIPVGHIADDCPHTEKRRKAMEDIVEEI